MIPCWTVDMFRMLVTFLPYLLCWWCIPVPQVFSVCWSHPCFVLVMSNCLSLNTLIFPLHGLLYIHRYSIPVGWVREFVAYFVYPCNQTWQGRKSPIYTLWLFNIAMERSTMLLIGKPSISMGHLYHGYVTNNQRVYIYIYIIIYIYILYYIYISTLH